MRSMLWLVLLLFLGCAPANVTPGMTFWFGLNGYQDEMVLLAGRPERWPERQRTAESLKRLYALTMGGSREFNRFVDLDLRRNEFAITLREATLRPERVKEMNQELATINEDMGRLKEIIKGQVNESVLRTQDQAQRIETIATLGLLNLMLDRFSPPITRAHQSAPSSKIGQNIVTDLGSYMSTVTLPDGLISRCITLIVQEEGAGIKCEPPAGKP